MFNPVKTIATEERFNRMNEIQLQQEAADCLAQAKYNDAVALYEQCIEANPALLSNYWYLGLAYLVQDQEAIAQVVWTSVLAEGTPDEVEVWTEELVKLLAAEAFRALKTNNLAIAGKIYSCIQDISPENDEALLGLGLVFFKQENFTLAISHLEKVDEKYLEFHVALYHLGCCFNRLKQFDQAIKPLKRCIEIRPDLLNPYLNLCYALKKQVQLDEVINTCEKALKEHPNSYQLFTILGDSLGETGIVDKALNYLFKALEIKDDLPEAYYSLGSCFRKMGKIDEAINSFNQVLNFNPDLIQARQRVEELASCKEAGYAPRITQGYGVWDAMLLKDDDIYRLFYLTGDMKAFPFWTKGEVDSAISTDLKTWKPLGTVLKPELQVDWVSGRILAGSCYKENGVYYFFYSAASSESILHEKIGLATSVDAIHWHHQPKPFLEVDERFYSFSPTHSLADQHYQWRDPYIVREESSGKYYMFISAGCKVSSNERRRGCVGLAVADLINGDYEILPPAVYPRIEGTEEGIYYEMERTQVIYKNGYYNLFFSARPVNINPNWLDKVGRENITSSTVYWYVSKTITGPYKPVSEKPIVKGSDKTGLYGTNFIESREGTWFAYGCYYQSQTLEIASRFPVSWEEDDIKILLN